MRCNIHYMKIISIKDLNHPVPIPLIVILALFLSFGKGSAKKADPLQHLLEKNNLQFHKKITIFDPGHRLNPGKNKIVPKIFRRLSVSEMRNLSEEYLKQNKELLDLKDISNQLRLDRVLKSPAGTHLYYQEMMEGIPVYNSGIVVSMNLDNEVSFISRNYSPDYRSGAIQVQISPAQALERAGGIQRESFARLIRAIARYELGQIDESDRELETLIADYADTRAYYIAMVYAWRRDNDQAVEWLGRAIDESQSIDALKTEPLFRNLYDDPRWEETLTRVGLADSQVSEIEFDVALPH